DSTITSAPSAGGYLLGKTRSRQGSPSAAIAGGVSLSWPGQNGQRAASSPPNARGRAARAGAKRMGSPVIGWVRRDMSESITAYNEDIPGERPVMPEPLSEIVSATTAVPHALATASAGLSTWQKRIVLLLAIVFASLPFFFIGDFEFRGYHLNDLDASGFFFSLGLLPGFIGIAYQVVHAAARREQGRDMLQQYYA